MDTLLIIIGFVLLIGGVAGCVLPVIPGPPLSFAALLLLHFTARVDIPLIIMIILGAATLIVTILDYIIPLWGTKKFGGSKAGVRGATAGLIVGLFLGPLGIIIGPFAGAVIGEMLAGSDRNLAFKAGIGSFLGFLTGVGLKLIVSLLIAFYFVKYLV